MISGREALSQIEQALSAERGKTESLDRQTAELNDRLLVLEQKDLVDFKELARLRIDFMATAKVESGLDKAEQLVQAMLAKRESDLADLASRISETAAAAAQLAREREEGAEKLAEISGRIDAAERVTQDRLDKDPEYVLVREAAVEAERIATHAESKAGQSEEELASKGKPYQDDPLFMYLWKRNFLSPDYRAGRLTRLLDGWVARLVGYGEARTNYSRLQEIPLRLREHAQAVRARANKAYETLRAFDVKARNDDGIVELDAVLTAAQEELDRIDEEIAEAADTARILAQNKAAFASGEDPHFQEAVDFLSRELRQDSLQHLYAAALATPFPEDDVVMARLLQRERTKADVVQSRDGLKELRAQHEARMRELEQVLVDFKKHRYDSPETGFSDGAIIAVMLGNFLSGLLNREALWKVLEQQRRYRQRQADPDFGSGGFGRGSMWGGGIGFPKGPVEMGRPFPRSGGRSGGGFRFPGGGRGRSGGFRTGGGF